MGQRSPPRWMTSLAYWQFKQDGSFSCRCLSNADLYPRNSERIMRAVEGDVNTDCHHAHRFSFMSHCACGADSSSRINNTLTYFENYWLVGKLTTCAEWYTHQRVSALHQFMFRHLGFVSLESQLFLLTCFASCSVALSTSRESRFPILDLDHI